MKKEILLGLGLMALLPACAPKQYVVQESEVHIMRIKDSIPANPAMSQFIAQYKGKLDAVMNEVLGETEVAMTKAQPESTLGNFMADAQLVAGKKLDNLVSISVVNYGGIRIPFVPKGPLTRGKVYEIMPFDNLLTIVDVPGPVLQQFCDHIATRKGWPVSGLSFRIQDGKAVDVHVGDEPLRTHGMYKVVTSDYVANGGDDCGFLEPLKKHHSAVLLRDALIEQIKSIKAQGKGIAPIIEKRITYAQ